MNHMCCFPVLLALSISWICAGASAVAQDVGDSSARAARARESTELLDSAVEAWWRNDNQRALDLLWEIVDDYSDTPDYPRALHNIGMISLDIGDTNRATEMMNAVLAGPFDDLDPVGRGEGIMAEPYAMYKHNACLSLASIAMARGQYQPALVLIAQADTVYRYRHFCGNEAMADALGIVVLRAMCLEGLALYDQALECLKPRLAPNGLASNDRIIEIFGRIMHRVHGAAMLDSAAQAAYTNLVLDSIETYGRPGGTSWAYGHARLLDVTVSMQVPVPAPIYGSARNEMALAVLRQRFRANALYVAVAAEQ